MQLAIDPPQFQLNGMLLQLSALNLLVPDNMVEEIAWPERVNAVANSPIWFKGYFSWQEQRIPLISFEELNSGGDDLQTEHQAGAAVAIVSGAINRTYLPYYAIALNNEPRLISLNKKSIAPDSGRQTKRAEACWITVDNSSALIPKIEWIEEHLLAYVLRASA